MGATIALQTGLVSSLDGDGLLSGVYHDAPPRAPFPYAVLNCSDERDWSCQGREGREIALQLTLWDEQPARLLVVEDRVEPRLALLDAGPDWVLSSLVLTGKRRSRDPNGPWSCTLEMRARLLAAAGGGAA